MAQKFNSRKLKCPSNRCFHKRVGSTLQWNIDRGAMVENRTRAPKNVLELMAVKFTILTLIKNISNLTILI